ncbi:MAG: penicillin acylase family protein [candidate division Zixibacteria bacterium]|nr:penicillin acylase family protein [candidate division Zixibacteria bacterium]
MSRTKKILLALLLLLVSSIVGGIYYLNSEIQGGVAKLEGELRLRSAPGSVEITFDSMGIGQIWAETDQAGFFALGYLHAADRLFQMELARRASSGRLSEAIGGFALGYDIRQRKIGHRRLAEKYLDSLSDLTRARLGAYVDGINAYANSPESLPFEFSFLAIEFAEWTILDCLALYSFQAWFSDAIQNRDEFFVRLAEKVGLEKAKSLSLPYPDWAPYTVPSKSTLGRIGKSEASAYFANGNSKTDSQTGISLKKTLDNASEKKFSASENFGFRNNLAKKFLREGGPFGLTRSSNSWVLSPSKTASGGAILAADPHLEITRLPQFWYAVGLHIEESGLNALGITTPGLPFIVMGHNGRSAWSFTAAGIDMTGYYIEEINPRDSAQYRTPDGWKEFEIIPETLTVAGSDTSIVIDVRYTRHGPIVLERDSLKQTYSLRWAGFDSDLSSAASAAFELMAVSSFDQFRNYVTSLGAIDANWFYADTEGNIGYQLGSMIPIRPGPQGALNFPVPGWTNDFEWAGYRSPDETPWAYNPAQGWLANCNNKQDQSNLDYELQGSFFADRILRLTEALSTSKKFSADDTRALQLERKDIYLMRWKNDLATLLEEKGENEFASTMRAWDGATHADSRETALINLFVSILTNLIFADELESLTSRVKRLWVDQIYHSDDQSWFDNTNGDSLVETRPVIARAALDSALALLGDKKWGDIHSLRMKHPLGEIPILGGFLGLEFGPWMWEGSGGSINASYYRDQPNGTFHVMAGPSWRFVIDMSDPDGATMVFPAGQSGAPGSERFFNFNKLWREGAVWETPFTKSRVYENAAKMLKIIPKSLSAEN